MYRRAQILLTVNALAIGLTAIVVSIVTDKALVDPEGSFLGPSWMRLPLLLAAAILADLVPRTLWLSKGRPSAMKPIFMERVRTHWTRDRVTLVAFGVIAFYIIYVCYRNLKSALPALIESQYDHELHLIDRAIFFGHEPGVILQNIFGTGPLMAHSLSYIYIWFLPLVPIAVTIWIVWSRNLGYGYWFVTSQGIAWTLGTASYYMLPTIGPGLQYPFVYTPLTHTATTDLMDSLVNARHSALWDTQANTAQTVAGFASLHTGITLLLALMVQYTLRNRILKIVFWANFGITVIATLYFGWHYVADDLAGVLIALVAFYVGGIVSGQDFRRTKLVKRNKPAEPELESASA